MVDLSDKGSESEDMNGKISDGASSEESHVKTCADCGTTKTPLWRGGPAGPKSLCNACGIRSRKKRRALLGLNKASTEDKKPKRNSDQNISVRKSGKNGKLGEESMKRQLLMLQRSTVEKLRKKLGEEEQAAVLLMSLSCGSVYG
ncbi:GATA transcription factor 16 [Actinidia rufa]|uniref:GATA transcription factor 16 n=1 Tax=Actinidia rufa TaxID=165716 RepID=A0A7J0GT82_9ERIC|nr:GATA transcription factor 16 [Actinidia rufa]